MTENSEHAKDPWTHIFKGCFIRTHTHTPPQLPPHTSSVNLGLPEWEVDDIFVALVSALGAFEAIAQQGLCRASEEADFWAACDI